MKTSFKLLVITITTLCASVYRPAVAEPNHSDNTASVTARQQDSFSTVTSIYPEPQISPSSATEQAAFSDPETHIVDLAICPTEIQALDAVIATIPKDKLDAVNILADDVLSDSLAPFTGVDVTVVSNKLCPAHAVANLDTE